MPATQSPKTHCAPPYPPNTRLVQLEPHRRTVTLSVINSRPLGCHTSLLYMSSLALCFPTLVLGMIMPCLGPPYQDGSVTCAPAEGCTMSSEEGPWDSRRIWEGRGSKRTEGQ